MSQIATNDATITNNSLISMTGGGLNSMLQVSGHNTLIANDFHSTITMDGTVNLMNLAGQAVRAPSRWPALLLFGYRQRCAVGELARFLDRFIRSLDPSVE